MRIAKEKTCSKRKVFFDGDNQLKSKCGNLGGSKTLREFLRYEEDHLFVDFLRECLGNWESRIAPEKALVHPWIFEGLPKPIQLQHLISMKQNFPDLDISQHLAKLEFELTGKPK